MEHIRNFLRGFGSVIEPLGSKRLYVMPSGGFDRDSANLVKDWQRVGEDLRKNSEEELIKYGKSHYSSGEVRQ